MEVDSALLGEEYTPTGDIDVWDSLAIRGNVVALVSKLFKCLGELLYRNWSKMMMVGLRKSEASEDPADSSNDDVSSGFRIMLPVVMCLTSNISTMVMRYSARIIGEKLPGNSIFLAGKIIILVISVGNVVRGSSGLGIAGKIQRLVRTSLPMALVAVMFQLDVLLIYKLLGRVGIETFYVCVQMKIVATAVFSALLLGRTFHLRQWVTIIIMVLGGTLVSLASMRFYHGCIMLYNVGAVIILVEVALSGLNLVFFEKALKFKVGSISVWDRSAQLEMWWIILSLPNTLHQDGRVFFDWTPRSAICVVLSSLCELTMIFTIKHLGALHFTFASAARTIVISLPNHVIFGDPFNMTAAIGIGCFVVSLVYFSKSDGINNCRFAASIHSAVERGCAQALIALQVPPSPRLGNSKYNEFTEEGGNEAYNDNNENVVIGTPI